MTGPELAVVALLPESVAGQWDFASRETHGWDDLVASLKELEANAADWRVITICHIEDLPLLMEPPDGMTSG